MFVDKVKVLARAGDGGAGCVAFQREAYKPKGGPSGGNGGRGGHVILVADENVNNLVAQYYSPRLVAQRGQHGMGKGKHGRRGRDLRVKVPCGTLIWQLSPSAHEDSTNEAGGGPDSPGRMRELQGEKAMEVDLREAPEPSKPSHGPAPDKELVADLIEPGQEVVLCRGGRGGYGNRHFATATRQAPRFAEPGQPGEEGEFELELRLVAEVGLVGLPNAGKSTLLSAVSHAKPKIAAYPFTTLRPQVGVVEYPDYFRLTLCDEPGLIEGASRNVGLGHAFLRHITRCKVLVLVVDIAGSEGRAPWDDFRQLLEELERYSPELLTKAQLVVANKIDEPEGEENLKAFQEAFPEWRILPMAAGFDEGLDAFKQEIRQLVDRREEQTMRFDPPHQETATD